MIAMPFVLPQQESDSQKLQTIYELYRKAMWYAANSILRDDYLAEDAVHNAFLGIFLRSFSHLKHLFGKP